MLGNLMSPGFAFLSSWQGILETMLRVACVVLSLIILICAAVASSSIDDLQGIAEDGNREYRDSENYGAAAGWLVFVGVMGMVIETTIIIVRFLNFSFIDQKFLIFGLSDIAISAVFVLALLIGGAANAAYSSDNADYYDEANCGGGGRKACEELETVRDAEGAAAAFSFIGMVLFGALAGIMFFVVLTSRYKKAGSSGPSSQEEPNN